MQWSGLWHPVPAVPGQFAGFVCCLSCLLNIQLRHGLLIVVKSAEIGGSGCLDDLGEARLTGSCLGEGLRRPRLGSLPGCAVWLQSEPPDAPGPRCLALFVPDSGLTSTERCLRHTVLRETREEPFERPLPKLVVDFHSPDCVATNSLGVVGAANSQTLSEEGKFRLRVLAELNTFVHRTDGVCRGQELIHDALSGSATPRVISSRVTVDILAMFWTSRILHSGGAATRSFTFFDDFCFQWVPLRSDSSVGDTEILQKRQHQGWEAPSSMYR